MYVFLKKEHFPLSLKEQEFRDNNHDAETFDQVANYLCDLVQQRD